MKDLVLSRLKDIENKHNVKILFACESGSRIWGFESSDSDWDVRFIYVRKLEWYLSVNRLNNFSDYSDVLEFPLEESTNLDISGWDLSKSLFLLFKSNCPLLEWLNTSFIYYSNQEFHKCILEASNKFYSRNRAIYHYYHMTNNNIKDYLVNRNIVWIKKYIYILRTLLACMWIEKNEKPIPVKIQDLILSTELPNDVRTEIILLIERKIIGEELGKGPANILLNDFIFTEIERIEKEVLPIFEYDKDDNQVMLPVLNNIFWRYTANI